MNHTQPCHLLPTKVPRMGLWKERRGSQWLTHSFLVKLLGWIGWLPVALSQLELSDAVSSSVSFLDAGVVSVAHIAVFASSILRGRLDLEMGARDVLASTRGPKLEAINGLGLTTNSDLQLASVVMLSSQPRSSSIKQFMRYISSAHGVDSVLLPCLPMSRAAATVQNCECEVQCHCILFWTVEQITIPLALAMPGTLKSLSDSLCLLPSLHCLVNGCHGCNAGLLHVQTEEIYRRTLVHGDPRPGHAAAACETLDIVARSIHEEHPCCVCIPIYPVARDDWTGLLTRILRCGDEDARGARVVALEALEAYLGGARRATVERVEYSNASWALPRAIEILVNALLTGLFRVDGFSSALTARRATRDYIVDARGNGFFASAFLAKALVDASAGSSHVCQVLTFRRPLMSLRALAFVAGGLNVVCALWWSLAVASGVGLGRWSRTYSLPLSRARFSAIMAAVGIGLGMDCLHLCLNRIRWREMVGIWAVISLEMMCIAAGGAVGGVMGVRAFGTWMYGALQAMVWVKWGYGSYLLGEYLEDESRWAESGILVYSSAFLLSAILAGVGGKWE